MTIDKVKTYVLCQKKLFSTFFILTFLRGSKISRGLCFWVENKVEQRKLCQSLLFDKGLSLTFFYLFWKVLRAFLFGSRGRVQWFCENNAKLHKTTGQKLHNNFEQRSKALFKVKQRQCDIPI